MAWSPFQRANAGIIWVEQPGDYANPIPTTSATGPGVDPETYLTDVLERMVSGATKNNRLHELLVWNWKAAREAEKAAA
jgi:hypothetical protein